MTTTVAATAIAKSSPPAPPLLLRFFGPMEVRVGGEPLPPVRSRKVLWLLALLALRAGRPVAREWLAGTLWPDAPPARGFANLRPALSQLRAALGAEAARLHAPDRHTLLLDLEGADADLPAFDAAVRRGDLASLEAAAALYRGPLLEGVVEEWVAQDREAREQDCLRALHRLAEAASAAGDPLAAAGYWRRAAALDPLSEVALRGLMAALAAAGDANAALAAYREFAAALRADDPRATPDPETAALYGRLRDEARRKAAAGAGAHEGAGTPAATAPPRVSGSLPHALTELIGRDDERLEVAAALERSRLVTLTGPGGIGKTRLAAEVAAEVVRAFPDGAWLVPLETLPGASAPAASPPSGAAGAAGAAEDTEAERQVLQQVATVLGVKLERGRAPLAPQVADHLRHKRLLLVLDNCEHLLEAAAGVAAHLLRECPGLRLLATSRESLRIDGEITWVVPALAAPDPDHLPAGGSARARSLAGYDAARLFTERAAAAQQGFALTGENAGDVAQLCARLGGVPLALELAAARCGVLTPAQILEQLDARPLDALASRLRDVAPRHRSLRATLEWSFDLLPPDAQEFLADLGVFRGGWTLEAAQALRPDDDAVALLDVLRDASLVHAAPDGADGLRFSMLEAVRQFAAEALERSGRAAEVGRRHAAYYADWLRENLNGWAGQRHGDFARFLVRTDREYANVGAAVAWTSAFGEVELLVRFCNNLALFWLHTGRSGEARHWFEVTARRIEALSDTPDRAAALRDNARSIQSQFYFIIGDQEEAARLLYERFEEALRAGRPQERRTELFNAALFRTAIDLDWTLETLVHHCLPLERECSEDGRGNPVVFSQLALVSRLLGQPERAAAYLAEALDLCRGREESNPDGYIRTQLVAARASWAEGDPARAQERFAACLSVSRHLGDPYMAGLALAGLATVAHEAGETEREREYLDAADAAVGAEPTIGVALVLDRRRAELRLAEGDRSGATTLVRERLASLRGKAMSFRLYLHPLLLLLAEAALPARPVAAAGLLGAAGAVAGRLCLRAPDPPDRERAARLRAELRERLGPERFSAEEAAGAARDDEAALDLALAPPPEPFPGG